MFEYEIVGEYQGQSEVLDTADTQIKAKWLAHEYKIAFGNSWTITIRRVPIVL